MDVEREQVVAFRMARQHLEGERLGPEGLTGVARMAPQNTPPGSAELALRARAEMGPQDVRAAVDHERTLLQVCCLRGSPCVLRVDELPLFTTGLLPDDEESWRALMPGLGPAFDLLGRSAREVAELVVTAARDALDGATLTKRELAAALGRQMPPELAPWFEPNALPGAVVARAASLTGEMTIAPRTGQEVSFVRTDQWLGGSVPTLTAPEARAALVQRYLRLYGPSTAADFARWAGVGEHFADRSWQMVRNALATVDYAGRRCWLLEEDLTTLAHAPRPRGLRLLPPYDPYLQQRDRSTAVPDTALHRRIWKDADNPGVVLCDGEVAALWWHRKQESRLMVEVEALESLGDRDRKAVQAEWQRLAEFRDCADAEVSFSRPGA